MTRQRYQCGLGVSDQCLRVSADRATNPAAHTRGKPAVLDLQQAWFLRDTDCPLEGAVTSELVSFDLQNSLLAGKIQGISSAPGPTSYLVASESSIRSGA
jgi:hypothetical protein